MSRIKALVICEIIRPDCNTRVTLHLLKMLLEESVTSLNSDVTNSYRPCIHTL